MEKENINVLHEDDDQVIFSSVDSEKIDDFIDELEDEVEEASETRDWLLKLKKKLN